MRKSTRGLLFDLDGVLYDADRPIAGAAETLAWARKREIPHLFVTNTTSRPRSALVEKLADLGIEADEERILTPPAACAGWLREQPEGAVALFVRAAARVEFAGFRRVPEQAVSGADYVVVGDLGEGWDYRTLNRAFRLLHHNPDALLVALGMTRFWQAADGIALDVAPFVAALEHAAGRRAVVLGKPAAGFFSAALQRLQLEAARVVMVGDDIRVDVKGAQDFGMKGVLVRTGKFRPDDLAAEVEPDAVIDSVADLPRVWDALAD